MICSNSGADKEIDVIDVSRQCDLKMRLGDFVEYYNSPNRERTLNVISLEFSETRYTTTGLFSRLLLPPSGKTLLNATWHVSSSPSINLHHYLK